MWCEFIMYAREIIYPGARSLKTSVVCVKCLSWTKQGEGEMGREARCAESTRVNDFLRLMPSTEGRSVHLLATCVA